MPPVRATILAMGAIEYEPTPTTNKYPIITTKLAPGLNLVKYFASKIIRTRPNSNESEIAGSLLNQDGSGATEGSCSAWPACAKKVSICLSIS